MQSLGGVAVGAWEVIDDCGTREVLKFGDHPVWRTHALQTRMVSEHLRANGYPAARVTDCGVLASGTAYYLQAFIAGTPLGPAPGGLSLDQLEVLLGVVDAATGLAPPVPQGWADYIEAVLFREDHEWGALAASTDPLIGVVLERARGLVDSHGEARFTRDDFVTGDLGPHNVLIADGAVQAVIDLESSGTGDRIIDLARLLRHDMTRDVRGRIHAEAERMGRVSAFLLAATYWALSSLHTRLCREDPLEPACEKALRRLAAFA